MDIMKLRQDFPLLKKPLIYFDTASTSQKPQSVIDAVAHFYSQSNANVHRGLYELAEEATQLYEDARVKVAHFIGARSDEIIFTRGTTESINFVARAWGDEYIQPGDEIVITQMEHHSNMVPWQQLAKRKGALLKLIPLHADGTLKLESLPGLLSKKIKIIAVSQVSNALGIHNDMQILQEFARQSGALFLIDAAQSVPHQKIDVKNLKCDFLAFSGHKMLGPTGIGVLYIKKDLHDIISPYQFGGGMIFHANAQNATWLKAPHKFEAGTPPIAQAIGLSAAIDYLNKNINFADLQKHEADLSARLIEGLLSLEKIKILGSIEQLKNNGHMVSFTVDGHHAHDVATYLWQQGICVRAGNHCAQPLSQFLNVDAMIRVSFYCYNTIEEVDALVKAMHRLLQ